MLVSCCLNSSTERQERIYFFHCFELDFLININFVLPGRIHILFLVMFMFLHVCSKFSRQPLWQIEKKTV